MRVLFTDATMLDGKGGYFEHHDVLVEGNRIVGVGPRGSIAHTDVDRIYDLQGMVLMPGMIDTHLHFAGGDYDPAHEHDPVGVLALRSLEAVQRSLLAGFTTVRSAGAQYDLDIDVRDAINQGISFGPRILASGRGLTMTGGHVHHYAIEADGVDEIRRAVRTLVKRGADSIKIFAVSAGVATAGADVDVEGFTTEEIRAAVFEATRARKLNQTHAIGLTGIKNAIAAGVTSIDHGIFLDEEACQMMKEKGTYLVPTFGPFYYYAVRRKAEPWRVARAEPLLEPHRRSFRMAMEMGVKIAMGSDLGAPSRMKNGENALELQLMVEAGMKPEDAIVAATSTAAELLKLDHLIGTVEPGKLADLVVVGRNPLDDITALQTDIRLVMRDGVIYRDELNM
ncbi:amidohydrolase family protein [Thermomicrobiaceae bacterium CFH 74404]|uniref:Amidohydrolase family protein n=1 Tax=Thermalbibacter longus TaxID=2951981 RepID=A0AA41WDE0_9BACT|nr:amidohydrolase family protein [Thermalbibacter longus]MCM8749947.1 amidohydrolase family protein [Thermalbibacter longus]